MRREPLIDAEWLATRTPPAQVAERTMDKLCAGRVDITARRLARFQIALLKLAFVRGFQRAWNQRSLMR